MPACSGRKCPSSFEEGGRFVSSPHRRHRRGQPLSSPPFHRFGPCLPAPRLFVSRLPRCGHLSLLPSPRLLRCRRLSLLPSPRLPRCGCRLPLLPSLCLLRCRRLRIPRHRTDRPSPAWSEMPPRPAHVLLPSPKRRHGPRFFCSSARSAARPVFLQLFYGTSHSRSPSLLCPGHKKTDGTAQRPVRRQKATNLSRQHHRGSSSTRQVSARA